MCSSPISVLGLVTHNDTVQPRLLELVELLKPADQAALASFTHGKGLLGAQPFIQCTLHEYLVMGMSRLIL